LAFFPQKNLQHFHDSKFFGKKGVGLWARLDSNQRPIGYERLSWAHLLRETPASELAQLAGVSKQYVSQVKQGQRPPSERLVQALLQLLQLRHKPSFPNKAPTYTSVEKALSMFLQSRREGISPETIREYRLILGKALKVLGMAPSTLDINIYLRSLTCSPGGKYGYFKDLRAFYRWLYSPRAGLGFNPADNPITWVDPPKRPKLILPSFSREQVLFLIDTVNSNRDKAIIAVLAESALRLTELATMKEDAIDWHMKTIRTLGKGNIEGY
ncbi:MAG: helix-turn-helix domain-containing protein, partial [Deltaproteobacteria bacterium]|nr:helix-turn-helix domain-containing protein [Deltaproteobacteria bacterium]